MSGFSQFPPDRPRRWRYLQIVACAALLPGAPAAWPQQSAASLPNAPGAVALAAREQTGPEPAGQGTPPQQPPPGQHAPPAPVGPRLTRSEAERMAVEHNPHISVSQLLALAQHEVVREARSAELPQVAGSITAEQAHDGSRISSGQLNASRLLTHAGAGVTLTQMITDFGRTRNRVGASRLREDAEKANAQATVEDIVLATDQAFYNALESQALLQVARQTVATRQTTQGQVNQLTQNNLRSTLDLSIANVDLSQAQLLVVDAQNNAAASMAALDEVLGLDRSVTYDLAYDTGAGATPPPPPADVEALTQAALKQRPDLQALNYDAQASERYSRAQRDQKLPTVAALGIAGGTPARNGRYYISSWDAAIGVNVNIPIFNGFLYSAEAKEAGLRAKATAEQSRALRDVIVRDVHTAWLDANNGFQRLAVTAQLVQQANLSLQLAQARYKIGLGSIVELSQAQLQQTQAEISNTNAQYQYRLTLAALNFQTGTTP